MVLVGISAVLALVNLLLWAWLHEKGESQHIGPVMAGLGLTVTSAFFFVLVGSERSPVALWLIGQLVIVCVGLSLLRWDRRTAPR